MNRLILTLLLILPLLQFSSEAFAQDGDGPRVRVLLKELSDLAGRIDAGKVKLTEARRDESQPDKIMRELRELMHQDARLVPQVLEFVRAAKEPLAAKLIVILALAQPEQQHLVSMTCLFLDDPPDVSLVQGVLAGFLHASNGDIDKWRTHQLELLVHLGCSSNYGFPERHWGMGEPVGEFSFANPPKGVDYRPLLRSLLGLLEKNKFPSMRWRIPMAAKLVREVAPMGPDRIRFAKLVATVYLGGGEGWRAAMEALASSGGFCGPDQLEILGRGLAGLDLAQKTAVLGEVAQNWGHEVFRPPFSDCFEDAIEHMGKPRSQNEPMTSTEWAICAMLIRQSLNDGWAERLLIKSPSVTLRSKAAGVLASLGQTTDRFEWKRFSGFLERMLADPDPGVRQSAIGTLHQALSRKEPPLDKARAEVLRKKLAALNR